MNFIRMFFCCLLALPAIAQEDCVNPDLIDPEIICTGIYMPVCGCNNVTYQNDCHATYYGGVTSWTKGECNEGLDPCTDVGGIDFGLCDMYLGIALVYGQCTSISGCGYIVDGVDYSSVFYESFENCTACEDSSGCVIPDKFDPSHECAAIYYPVCGCDNSTYANACYAYYYGGISEWTSGECTTINPCTDVGDLDFGVCAFPLGIAVVNGVCTSLSGCGYTIDGVDYSSAFYDSMEECEACGNSSYCFNEDQVDEEFPCTEEFQPVCGCDNVTYSNSCHAYFYGGVASWTNGECAPIGSCTDVGYVDFGDCAMPLGIAVVNGQCTFLSGCGYVVDGIDYSSAFHDFLQDCAYCQSEECMDNNVIDLEFGCFEDYVPVCGCDNVTYPNECYAYYFNGITSWTAGACDPVGIDEISEIEVEFLAGNALQIKNLQVIENISVFDLSGKVIIEEYDIVPGEHQFKISGVNPGIYIYRIRIAGGRVINGKVLIH